MDRTETPDLGKVIRGLRCCTKVGEVQFCVDEGCPYALVPDDCINVLMSDALALLKAQEPVEPVVDIDTWKCGKCGHTLEHQELLGDNVLFHEQYICCPCCGKRVKWGG